MIHDMHYRPLNILPNTKRAGHVTTGGLDEVWLVVCWSLTSCQHLRSYHERYRAVIVHTHDDFVVLSHGGKSSHQCHNLISHSVTLSWYWALPYPNSAILIILTRVRTRGPNPRSPCTTVGRSTHSAIPSIRVILRTAESPRYMWLSYIYLHVNPNTDNVYKPVASIPVILGCNYNNVRNGWNIN